MTTLGGDPDQMRALARQIELESQQLETTFRAMTGKLGSTAWRGPDATAFRDRWESYHRARMTAAVGEMRAAAATLRAEALAQERISRS